MNKANPDIKELGNGIWQVKVPLPFPLLWVNAYVAKDADGAVDIIDPGLRTEQALKRWEEAPLIIGFRWTDVRSILLTHHHPDHYGLSGWMQSVSGAPVLMSAEALDQANRLWGEKRGETAEAMLELFSGHGLPGELLPDMRRHLESFVPLVSPPPATVRTICGGESVMIGGRSYAAVHTPGHALGHLSFWDEDRRVIFCGDHVLPGITPNVSLLPFGDEDPLAAYLASLRNASRLTAALALPGHREPFAHYADRARAIAAHHDERLKRIMGFLSAPATGYEVCRFLFGDNLSLHQLRFALSETIAHLVYLERRGFIRQDRDGPALRYAASPQHRFVSGRSN